jgi:hypothetical protein
LASSSNCARRGRGQVPGAGAPAGSRNLGHLAGGQEALGADHLQDQFRERETGKTYLALVRALAGQQEGDRRPLHKYLQPTASAACA